MSENSNNVVKNRSHIIPPFVGQYRRRIDETIPQIVVDRNESVLSKAEKMVSNFFKCTKDWDKCEAKDQTEDQFKCFATKNSDINFKNHLTVKHPKDDLFCVYCFHLSQTTDDVVRPQLKMYSHRYLIKHMLKRHRFRRFQCNQCLYRAITEDHIVIHQKKRHEREYLKSISGNGVSNDVNINVCKIFLCQTLYIQNLEYPTLEYYYRKHRTERINSTGKYDECYQCLYCQKTDELLGEVIYHCVERHPDYPILYYIPEPQICSSTTSELVNDFITYDNIASVRPKLEPQDNSISSTYETEIQSNSQSVKRKAVPEEDETNSSDKRLRLETNDQSISSNQLSINFVEPNQQKICLFCNQLFNDCETAKTHLETHFVGTVMSDSMKKLVSNWIQNFLLKQNQLSSFEDNSGVNQMKVFYCCPLCVKFADIYNKSAKRYATYKEVETHLWDHCCWASVRCQLCQTFTPNCDQIIVNHIKANHFLHSNKSKYNFLNTDDLCPQKEIKFSSEERLKLQNKFIEVNENPIIESFIKQLLKQLNDNFEQQLRADCGKRFPTVVVPRMPENKFKEHFDIYAEYESSKVISLLIGKNKEKKEKKGRKKSTESNDSVKSGEKVDKMNEITHQIDSVKNIIGESSGQSSSAAINDNPKNRINSESVSDRNAFNSTESVETNQNRGIDGQIDNELENEGEEELHRYCCYHCNDKFKSKNEFREHSKKVHPNKSFRCFAKLKKTSDS